MGVISILFYDLLLFKLTTWFHQEKFTKKIVLTVFDTACSFLKNYRLISRESIFKSIIKKISWMPQQIIILISPEDLFSFSWKHCVLTARLNQLTTIDSASVIELSLSVRGSGVRDKIQFWKSEFLQAVNWKVYQTMLITQMSPIFINLDLV